MNFFSVVTVNLSEMRVKLGVKPNVENERSCFMHSSVVLGGRRKPSNFPVLLLLPHTGGCT